MYIIRTFCIDYRKMFFALVTKVIIFYMGFTLINIYKLVFKAILQDFLKIIMKVLTLRTVLKICYKLFLEYCKIKKEAKDISAKVEELMEVEDFCRAKGDY